MLSDVVVFILGACVGSFMSVVVTRAASGSFPTGRSVCDGCGRTLRFFELAPVVSWVVQKGRSACCKTPLSTMYPLIEATMGGVFVLVSRAVFSGMFGDLEIYQIFAAFVIAAGLVGIFFADVRYRIIPDIITGTLVIASLVIVPVELLFNHIVAGFLLMGLLYCLHFLTRGRGMGLGDVKFAFVIGLLLGAMKGFLALYVGFVIGGVAGLALLISGKQGLKSTIAFGPFLVVGLVIMLVWGDSVVRFVNVLW